MNAPDIRPYNPTRNVKVEPLRPARLSFACIANTVLVTVLLCLTGLLAVCLWAYVTSR